MKDRSMVKLVLALSLTCGAEAVNAQAPAVANKVPATPATSKTTTSKPPVTKKIAFAEDTFSAKRKLLDDRAQSLSEQELEAQKKAAADGAPDSMYLLGASLLRAGDEAAARHWWAQAAERDDLFAMVALAELPSTDAAEKRKWFEKAAASGVPPAEYHFGEILLTSQGGPAELAEGKKLILKSAADGSVDAQNLVGASYLGLSSKYRGLLETNSSLGQQYLQAAKIAHSAEARNTLRLAVEKGLLPDPFKGAPQLDGGEAFLAYLRKLDPEDRIFYLRQQVTKYPQSARRTKALEEIVWLSPNLDDEPDFKVLQTEDPTNSTVQVLSLSAELDRMQGRPLAEPANGEVKTVSDVIDRWRAATGFDRLAKHSYMLTHETMTIAGEEKPHQINCATDFKNMRQEEPEDLNQITAAKDGRFQYYRPQLNGDGNNLKFEQAADKYNNSTTYLAYCLNMPLSVQAPDQFQFAGIKTFLDTPAYALIHNGGDQEDYFDTKSFFYLGSQQSKGAWIKNAFGYHDFGGAVLPQYVLFHNGNNIRLRKFTALQWDQPPNVDGDIFTLALIPVPQYPQSKYVKPVLTDVITQNEMDLQPARVQQQLEKLQGADVLFGLDPVAQKDRRAIVAHLQMQAAALLQNSQQWDQIAAAIFTTVVQHDRQRRFKNPVDARDVFLNWQDVTNLKSLLAHNTLRVQLKHSMSGDNSEMSYCAWNDAGNFRNESVNSLAIQNNEHAVSFGFDKKSGFSQPQSRDSNAFSLRSNFISSCLLGIGETSLIEYPLSPLGFGTGTIYKRPAYVIFQKSFISDSMDDATRYFFDKETFLLLGIQDGKDESPTSFSDFRKVGDSILPFRQYKFDGGPYPTDKIDTIEKLDFDVSIDAKEFDLNPRPPQEFYATTLREKRPGLYKNPSPWAALATGALLGVAQGAANNPSLFANAQQAQLTSLQATILAHQVGGDLANQGNASFTGITANQSALQFKGSFTPGHFSAPSAPLMTPAQLQTLEGLILSSSSDGKGSDSFSSSLLDALKQMAGQQGNSIQEAANQQSAVILAIGNANAAKQQQNSQARQPAQLVSQSNSNLATPLSGATPAAGSAQQPSTPSVPASPASFTITGGEPGNPVQTGFTDTQTSAPLIQYTGALTFNIPSGFHIVGGEVSIGGTNGNGDPAQMVKAFNEAVTLINQGNTCSMVVGSFGGTNANIQNNRLTYQTVPGQTLIAACIAIAPIGMDNARVTYQGAAEVKMPAGVSVSMTKAPNQ